jgi:type II secretion system protein C
MDTAKKTKAAKLPLQAATEAISIDKIYENDLFDTYHEKVTAPVEPDYINPIPTPPTQTAVEIPEDPIVPFLPPLAVTLKGIMIVNDDSKNMVMIEDNASKKEEIYKVGDLVEDAQLVRILHNKIVLVRSNGQFETLYLSEKDVYNQAALDDAKNEWAELTRKLNTNMYEVDPVSFAEVVPDLSHLIDMLDLTTVYKKGKVYGCRIGKVTSGSLAQTLGFESHDIITAIASLSTSTTDNRFEIYQKISHMPLGSSFTIEFERAEKPQTISFTLTDLKNPLLESQEEFEAQAPKVGIIIGPSPEELEQERIQLLQDRYTFAQTAQDILIEQRQIMSEANNEKAKNVLLSSERNL